MIHNSNIPIDSEHLCSDSNDLPLEPPPNDQLGFMAALHPDIVFEILSFLDQADCLTCMAVCRDWYQTIPKYSEGIWTILKFNARDVQEENQRQIRCLGEHVKSVSLDAFESESDVYYVLHKLFDWGCTKIKCLEFYYCLTDDQDAFLDALTKLAPHLTHLGMINHRSNIAFLHLFQACPELTHFTYEMRMSDWWRSNVYDQEPAVARELSSSKLATKITHLCLDLIMKPTRIYSILRNSPELRCYVGPSKRATVGVRTPDENFGYNTISINLDRLFDMCPKVNHVQPFFTLYNIGEVGDIDMYTNNPNCTGLRNLDICVDYGGDQIAGWLSKNQDTLEHLSLELYSTDYRFDWSAIFRSLRLSQLHTLKVQGAQYDALSLVAMLNNCPVLETLVLDCKSQKFDPPAIQSLCPQYRLRTLECDSLHIDDICLKMLLDRCPVLEKLVLSIATISLTVPRYMGYATNQLKHFRLWSVEWITNDDDDTSYKKEAVGRFFRYWTAKSKIEILSLTFVQMFGHPALISVAEIPTLKECNVILDPTRVNGDELVQFTNKLHGTAIENLSLCGIEHMSFSIFNTLAELPLLRELDLPQLDSRQCVCKISVLGLLQMLHRSNSLKTITFRHALLDDSLEGIPDHDSLSALVKQEAPTFYVEKEEKYMDVDLSIAVCDVIVKRRV
ncbi:hypothetical protein BJV82DRAFT_636983 [Fennellomyces sp. T-0311]|nr:hypothetical protein BJV82DRAFT_636983 [Fennellomyces sp. T-0311]